MANKTADQILSTAISGARGASSATQQALHAEASRQLFEATEREIIGEANAYIATDDLISDQAISFAIQDRLKNAQRAKARAFYGITETEQEGAE